MAQSGPYKGRRGEIIPLPRTAASDLGHGRSIWPVIAAMDYLLENLEEMSPMSAHLLRMSRQNLLDEFLPRATKMGPRESS
ncbi:hypothetical protein V6C03_04540 [Methyloligella sp. 2.7D]|uniref:hypothetical protein n=1 Tax=unclassified Methyloligella TaxID=2625955 RepID=UPI00157C2EFB|nr:hypothetical protein [Methyloligella sp. GL2]QKP76135.1 hypothetical protein HT051_00890 [Methyloligella sp. GL2]